MPHKCTKCGREFEDGSTIILKGCPSCAGKKFLYVKESQQHDDVLKEKSPEELAEESRDEVLEVKPEPAKSVQMYDRIESVRILAPGSYELNIEKLAESDERVFRLDTEGKYVLDIISMMKKQKKKK